MRYHAVVTPLTTRRRSLRLSTQVLVLLLGILLISAVVDAVLTYREIRSDMDRQAGQNSLRIARSVATDPTIVDGFAAPDPARAIDPAAETVRRATGATFIVITNRQGIRYSHPDSSLIGTSLLNDPGENPAAVLSGGTYIGVQNGSLGRSMRAKVPVRDGAGQVIGLVSVGTLEDTVSSQLLSRLPSTFVPPLLALALSVAGTLLLTRRIKRQTYGLEPAEITGMLEHREAMLHSIAEGVITLDLTEHVTMINDEAQRLLGIERTDVLGRRLPEFVPAGRVRDVLGGHVPGRDEIVLLGKRILVVNHMPVDVRGRPIGAVITLRDRTELEGLLRELDDSRSLADALRSQEHEFANRLHVIGGLIELGRYDDAVEFINHTSVLHQQLAAQLVDGVSDPIVSALLLGKAAVAGERGITLSVSATGELPADLDEPQGLVTVLGNLIDNALESVTQAGPEGGRVDVGITTRTGVLEITVRDTGPGVDASLADEIFRHGFTTKAAHAGNRRRGIGLALVSREVCARGGHIAVRNVDGALFTVTIPLRERAAISGTGETESAER
ncbi:sensor histidine kinase [Nocardia sp. NEAU-G5]|uniref:histidine kinase n=1 Tax=Nocardia albiluteola TaxID=2842303 RepID=A0ABS6BA70_9NOCA|nr:sensor histidine kinase [Nocardia albiluteola]MBU3067190.1 sensor histidine kinase [Nocardia albiluteola]